MTSDIAIIGMSVELPQARDLESFWDVIRSGRSLTRPFPAARRQAVEEYVRYHRETTLGEWPGRNVDFHDGSFLDRVDLFDPEFFGMTPKQASVADPHQRLILRTMYLALEDAGYTGHRLRGSRTGVFVGFAANPGQSYLEYCCRIDPSLAQLGLTGNITTMLANRLSYLLDLRGPSLVVDSACSASLVALHQAKNALLLGDCEMAVVAGSRVVLAPVQDPLTRIGIESSDGVTRTFDEAADGTGFGEGSGVVVLKTLDRAVADGDQVYAVLKGSAVNHDGHSESMTTPDAAAQASLLLSAWAEAGIDPASIGYLEAHGTATRVGDPIEVDGLRRAFAAHTDATGFCAVGTVKANIGHLFEGSGVLGLIKAALMLRHRELPPLANYARPNGELGLETGPVYVNTTLRPWPSSGTPRRCGVSAFGLGGTNSHAVLEEYLPPAPPVPVEAGRPWLFTLSAQTEGSLRRLVRGHLDLLSRGLPAEVSIMDVCYTTNVSRSAHRYRLALVVDGVEQLRRQLAEVAAGQVMAPASAPVPAGELARSYLDGDEVDLLGAYAGHRPRIVRLPGYEFEEVRCWVDFPADWRTRAIGGVAPVAHPSTHQIGFLPAAPAPTADATAAGASVVALVDPANGAESLLRRLELGQTRFLTLRDDDTGDDRALDAAELTDPALAGAAVDGFRVDESELERVADLVVDGGHTHVVHALAFESDRAEDVAELDRRIRKNLGSLFLLGKALMAAGGRLTLVVLTRRAVAATRGEPDVVAENGALAGLAKSISREYPYLTVRFVDTDPSVPDERLRDELLHRVPGVHVLRGELTYREHFSELPEVAPAGTGEDYLRPGGAYLITGGTGGIGLAVARFFATSAPGLHLFLLSRSGVPPREEWDGLLAADSGGALAERVRAVRDIEELGAQVHPVRGDAGDADDVARVVAGIREKFGRLDGVVHAAGIPGENPIVLRELADFEAVLRPKLRGAFLLDQLTRDDRPDFVLHLSSVAAVFPALGQSDYAAANFYLDNLATANADPRCRVLAIDWVAWREVGMAVASGVNEDLAFRSMPTTLGLSLIDAGLRSGRDRLFAGEINYDSELMDLITAYPVDLDPVVSDKIETAMAALEDRLRLATERMRASIGAVEVELTGRPDGGYTAAELMVGRCVAHAFGYPSIDITADFRDMGADSITALTVASNISACLGEPFDAVDLLTERTVVGVAAFIESAYDVPVDAFDESAHDVPVDATGTDPESVG